MEETAPLNQVAAAMAFKSLLLSSSSATACSPARLDPHLLDGLLVSSSSSRASSEDSS
jgi:hypothetical protein